MTRQRNPKSNSLKRKNHLKWKKRLSNFKLTFPAPALELRHRLPYQKLIIAPNKAMTYSLLSSFYTLIPINVKLRY